MREGSLILSTGIEPADRKFIVLDTGIKAINGALYQRIGLVTVQVLVDVLLAMLAKNTAADVAIVNFKRGREVQSLFKIPWGRNAESHSCRCARFIAGESRRAAKVTHAIASTSQVSVFLFYLIRVAMRREVGLATGEPPTTKDTRLSVSLLPSIEKCGVNKNKQVLFQRYILLAEADDRNDPVVTARAT